MPHRSITARDAALIQRLVIEAALEVARMDEGLDKIRELAATNPHLRPLARALTTLEDRAMPMMVCDLVTA